jgi:hypothetical protein
MAQCEGHCQQQKVMGLWSDMPKIGGKIAYSTGVLCNRLAREVLVFLCILAPGMLEGDDGLGQGDGLRERMRWSSVSVGCKSF